MASVQVIRCAMIVWVAAKVCEVVVKVQTEAIIARKSCAKMLKNSIGGANILGPA